MLLTRRGDRAEGRFDREWAGFMCIRHDVDRDGALPERNRATATHRTTTVDYLRPWDNLVVWFIAGLAMPLDVTYGHVIDETTGAPGDVFLSATDGSWCEVSAHPDQGARSVLEGGPRQLWRAVEDAYRSGALSANPGGSGLALPPLARVNGSGSTGPTGRTSGP